MSEGPQMNEQECVKVGKDGKPFGSESSAERFMQNIGLDPDVWGPYRYDGGYAVKKHRFALWQREQAQEKVERDAKERSAKPMEYKRVIITGRNSPSDWPKAWANVNGQFPAGIEMERGKEIVLPMSLINVLRDAWHPSMTKPKDNPEVPMVEGEPVYTFPLNIVGDATEKEWLEFLGRGRVAVERTKEAYNRDHH